jgi:hypothetical protein
MFFVMEDAMQQLVPTVLGFAKWRIFSTNVQLKNRT